MVAHQGLLQTRTCAIDAVHRPRTLSGLVHGGRLPGVQGVSFWYEAPVELLR